MRSWAMKGMWLISAVALGSLPVAAQAKTHHYRRTGHHKAGSHTPSVESSPSGHRTPTASHSAHHSAHHVAYRAHGAHHHGVQLAAYHGRHQAFRHHSFYHGRFHGISCVPFARAESGIHLVGNAYTWWGEAAGRYARGDVPEPGSVLNFRSNPSMRLGHVAVVRAVINSRQVLVDQANWWGPGGGHGVISRDIAIVDVSPHNDWSAVRVALGRSGNYGSVYPTYGFIYDRPEDSLSWKPVQLATTSGTHPLNPVPRDLRPRTDRVRLAAVHTVPPAQYQEVAELPPAKSSQR